MKNLKTDVLIVGGGAAGLMAAAAAAEKGMSVTVLEPNEKLGRKLRITGKGRCNVTNDCDEKAFFSALQTNAKFMRSALYAFPPSAAMDYFESIGVPLKTERGNRVFPVSDRADDIADALERHCLSLGVTFVREKATDILLENGSAAAVKTPQSTFFCRNVLLATGGVSYPATGSTGDGYVLAEKLGHSVIPPRASLVPLETDDFCPQAQGLSLRNVTITLFDGEKKIYSELGEMLFTHFGISGPLALTASTYMKKPPQEYRIELDLKPALSEEKLDERLLRDFAENANKDFINSLDALLPQKLIGVMVSLSEIPERLKVNSVTREQRRRLVSLMKHLPISAVALRPLDEAIITAGGICVDEVNPRSMESKLVPCLFFAGEILDVDALTGGYNLQIAWSTARMAAEHFI